MRQTHRQLTKVWNAFMLRAPMPVPVHGQTWSKPSMTIAAVRVVLRAGRARTCGAWSLQRQPPPPRSGFERAPQHARVAARRAEQPADHERQAQRPQHHEPRRVARQQVQRGEGLDDDDERERDARGERPERARDARELGRAVARPRRRREHREVAELAPAEHAAHARGDAVARAHARVVVADHRRTRGRRSTRRSRFVGAAR